MMAINATAVKAYSGTPAKWEELAALYHF